MRIVKCDKCAKQKAVATDGPNTTFTAIATQLFESGWSLRRGEWFCRECSE